ncbi:MAG TPA: type II toxin-antitoxin system VapC family toxin [Thermoanaerobaculia bacterium]|nr:type II toxin-antitoxin system VapC family toxin [Thermoanaerobaculia bacterium]
MKVLLDTCTFLWAALDSPKLSPKAREILLSPAAERLLSAASAWEVAIKVGRKQLEIPGVVHRWVPMAREKLAVAELPVDEESALAVERLPPLHRDPFDRILISQAVVHGCTLLTPDPAIQAYAVRVIW